MKIDNIYRKKAALDEAILKLNQLLKSDQPEQITFAIHEIWCEFKVDFKVVNLSYYTLELLVKAEADKVKFTKMQYFEKAASSRDLEYECIKYLGYKNQFNKTLPEFIYEDEEIQLLFTEHSEIIMKIESIIHKLPARE